MSKKKNFTMRKCIMLIFYTFYAKVGFCKYFLKLLKYTNYLSVLYDKYILIFHY